MNARDAMPRGGRLSIEVANVGSDVAQAPRPEGAAPGPYVMLSVKDSGVGMDAATRERIFEPFFTTKETGKGTGLGLATVFGIVQQGNGYIMVESEPGRGSTFQVFLPRTDDQAEPVAEEKHAPAKLGGSETILVVEDDAQVRLAGVAILRRNGYQVLEARDGIEARRVCEEHARGIDLLLTDMVMPRMGGRELADSVTRTRPRTRVLYMSGYTEDAALRGGVLAAGTAFLQKPFTPESLLVAVRAVLDAKDQDSAR